MHSLAKILLCAAWFPAAAYAQESPGPAAPPADANVLTPAAVQAAVDGLRRDSNLGRDKTVRSLHWVDRKNKPPPSPADAPAWIVGLFQFLSQAGSALIWVAGAIGLAIAAVWVHRLLMLHRPARRVLVAQAGSRVQDLDITPGSLPPDIGAAALALLEAGRTREALSLLYRGALSRAVHRFAVIVGESYTEGEALRAVGQRLDLGRIQYFAALVALWQRVVYAADVPAPESIAALCREFSATFDAAGAP